MLLAYLISAFALGLVLYYFLPFAQGALSQFVPKEIANHKYIAIFISGGVLLIGLLALRWLFKETSLTRREERII